VGLVAQYCCDLFDLRDKHIRFKDSEVNEEIILSFLIKHEKHMHDLEVTTTPDLDITAGSKTYFTAGF